MGVRGEWAGVVVGIAVDVLFVIDNSGPTAAASSHRAAARAKLSVSQAVDCPDL